MWKDPIVEEVRAARERIAAECGYDLKRILQRDADVLKRWKGKVVTKEELMKQRAAARSASQQK